MKTWLSTWKSSQQPRKQRKYVHEAPYHVQGNFLSAHLSKDLRKKYQRRHIRIRKGDKVKILKGQFKGQEGKIERVDLKNLRVYLTKIEVDKKDGSKVKVPIRPANLVILELDTNDKRRMEKLKELKV